MKKRIFAFVFVTSLLAASCSKNSSSNSSNRTGGTDSTVATNPKEPVNPVNPVDPIIPPRKDEMLKLNFGTNGFVTLNNDTGEYKIDKLPTSKLDFDFLQPVKFIFDSYISDPIYVYKSSLFPIDRHSLYQIPDIINFDTINSLDSRPSNNKYDVSIQFWGSIGNKRDQGFYICYKSVDNSYAKFDFIVQERDDLYSNPSCDKYKNLIDEKKVTPLNFKSGDFILLRFSGFRAYTSGECFNNSTCIISYNINMKYFTQIK